MGNAHGKQSVKHGVRKGAHAVQNAKKHKNHPDHSHGGNALGRFAVSLVDSQNSSTSTKDQKATKTQGDGLPPIKTNTSPLIPGPTDMASTSAAKTPSSKTTTTPSQTSGLPSKTGSHSHATSGRVGSPALPLGKVNHHLPNKSSGLSTGAIAGIVVGAVIVLIALFLGGWFFGKRQKKKKGEKIDDDESSNDEEAVHEKRKSLDITEEGLVRVIREMDGAPIYEADGGEMRLKELHEDYVRELDGDTTDAEGRGAISTLQGERYELDGSSPSSSDDSTLDPEQPSPPLTAASAASAAPAERGGTATEEGVSPASEHGSRPSSLHELSPTSPSTAISPPTAVASPKTYSWPLH